jgi:hypothetical protein
MNSVQMIDVERVDDLRGQNGSLRLRASGAFVLMCVDPSGDSAKKTRAANKLTRVFEAEHGG